MSTISAEREQEYGIPYGKYAVNADMNYINSERFARKFDGITENKAVNATLLKCARSAIAHRNGTLYEDMYLIDGDTGEIMAQQLNSECEQGVFYNGDIRAAIAKAKAENIPLIAFHSHPEGYPPSVDDFNKAFENNYFLAVIAGHNGQVYVYYPPKEYIDNADNIQFIIVTTYNGGADIDRAYREAFEECDLKYDIVKE